MAVMLILIQVTTACLSAMIAEYAGTTNKVGNGFGVFFIFLFVHLLPHYDIPLTSYRYLAFQGTGQDTTMYLWVSEIFPTGKYNRNDCLLNFILIRY